MKHRDNFFLLYKFDGEVCFIDVYKLNKMLMEQFKVENVCTKRLQYEGCSNKYKMSLPKIINVFNFLLPH